MGYMTMASERHIETRIDTDDVFSCTRKFLRALVKLGLLQEEELFNLMMRIEVKDYMRRMDLRIYLAQDEKRTP
jgi:hypothetical protein